MKYEVMESKEYPGDWTVGAVIDPPEGDGDIYLAIFSGPQARERAMEYEKFKTTLEQDRRGHSIDTCLRS